MKHLYIIFILYISTLISCNSRSSQPKDPATSDTVTTIKESSTQIQEPLRKAPKEITVEYEPLYWSDSEKAIDLVNRYIQAVQQGDTIRLLKLFNYPLIFNDIHVIAEYELHDHIQDPDVYQKLFDITNDTPVIEQTFDSIRRIYYGDAYLQQQLTGNLRFDPCIFESHDLVWSELYTRAFEELDTELIESRNELTELISDKIKEIPEQAWMFVTGNYIFNNAIINKVNDELKITEFKLTKQVQSFRNDSVPYIRVVEDNELFYYSRFDPYYGPGCYILFLKPTTVTPRFSAITQAESDKVKEFVKEFGLAVENDNREKIEESFHFPVRIAGKNYYSLADVDSCTYDVLRKNYWNTADIICKTDALIDDRFREIHIYGREPGKQYTTGVSIVTPQYITNHYEYNLHIVKVDGKMKIYKITYEYNP